MEIGLIGGSVSTSIYLPENAQTWPNLLAQQQAFPVNLTMRQQGMLTISRALPLASEFPAVDVLILSFATTLGWPVISKSVANLLAPEFQSETALHLAAFSSRSRKKRIQKRLRRAALNLLKFAAYPFGLYRPTNNLSDLDDQVRALVSIAFSKAQRVVWVQHQPMRDNRIWLERRTFDRYYQRLIQSLSAVSNPNFVLVEFPEEFLKQSNYCLDEVHLSQAGHVELAGYLHDLNLFGAAKLE